MLITIIAFLAVLTALVFVHELGHFWVARKSGVSVKEFSIGMPPRAIGIRKRNNHKTGAKGLEKWEILKGRSKEGEDEDNANTIFSISWLPIGGFVRMKGEDDAETGPDSFSEATPGKRAAILVAGVVMNFVLAVILMSIVFGIGFPTVVESQEERSRVDNVNLTVLSVLPGSPAERSGIKEGDYIVGTPDQSFESVRELQDFVGEFADKSVNILVSRDGKTMTIDITPEYLPKTDSVALGVALAETGIIKYGFFESIWQGTKSSVYMTRNITVALGDILKKLVSTGKVEEDIAGPIGIAVMTGKAVDIGMLAVLQFAAILSINLAIINIMPFPALDGGQLIFVIIEKLRGRPLSRKVMQYTNMVGFSLLMLLVLAVTFKDIGTFGIINAIKNIF